MDEGVDVDVDGTGTGTGTMEDKAGQDKARDEHPRQMIGGMPKKRKEKHWRGAEKCKSPGPLSRFCILGTTMTLVQR